MKTKIFALFLGMLCLLTSALAQSTTLTGFNGRIKFTSFANNGLYVRGTLDDFLDQTNQYVASDIDSADVVWDNQGRRYLVHDVISSNLTQAVVDLSRIGGGSHIPTGVGFVSRETSNGLALVPPVNSTGISTQLASRAGVHNAKILEGLKTIYTGSDSIKVLNILVKMADNGSQTIAFGYWPNFPNYNYGITEHGWFYGAGQNILKYKRDEINMFNGFLGLYSRSTYNSGSALIEIDGDAFTSELAVTNRRGHNLKLQVDSTGINFVGGASGSDLYKFPIPSVSKPSATSGRRQLLSWTAGLPSFSDRYVSDTLWGDVHIKMASDGSGTYAVGHFPSFPNRDYDYNNEFGLYISPLYAGEVSLVAKRAGVIMYDDYAEMTTIRNNGDRKTRISTAANINLSAFYNGDTQSYTIQLDSNYLNILRGGTFYSMPNPSISTPSGEGGAFSSIIWIAGTPSFLRSQHKTVSGTTDGSGDILLAFDATMPDATYTVIVTGQGSTPYVYMTQSATLATGSVKVRMFTLAGAAATSTGYQISYEVKDNN